jgi:DNA replication and repair protein RecF
VRLNYLSLTNFRNYVRLELNLPDRLTLVQGANAQGKTALLEAIHLLATARSPRATAERELINWLAVESPLPYARLAGEIGEGKDAQKLELVLELASNGSNGPTVRKQVRINGAPKRALDLVGRLRVVLFLPEDVSLVAGAPAERRRYLDIALCQISTTYCRALADYNRVVTQRNALLRRLRDSGGDAAQLGFWDTQMVDHGSLLVQRRNEAIQRLDQIAGRRHEALANGDRLRLTYLPGIDVHFGVKTGTAVGNVSAKRWLAETPVEYWALSREEIKARFAAQLRHTHGRDVAAGTSLTGPHRDDMSFAINNRDVRTFGSRGQQRTAALALKLAEVQMMYDETQDHPLLLLDDVMSELDAARRHALLDALAGVSQAIVTTTDLDDFSAELRGQARILHVEQGVLTAG